MIHLAHAQRFSYIILSLFSLLGCPSEAALENCFFIEEFVKQLRISCLCIFNSRKYVGCRYVFRYDSHPQLDCGTILVNTYFESQTP